MNNMNIIIISNKHTHICLHCLLINLQMESLLNRIWNIRVLYTCNISSSLTFGDNKTSNTTIYILAKLLIEKWACQCICYCKNDKIGLFKKTKHYQFCMLNVFGYKISKQASTSCFQSTISTMTKRQSRD